ncbi:DUF7079 family protein [Hymenobacter norwichensis]|uniref:DUF7079 family protein n=1 Tax=Hymenobacter norwichensis TaxID=223903 RepID=UPI0003B3BC5C|nr:hypothetical protein [Hymenobacter norwichensis]
MFRENATARTPVWIALAALYLDTELTDDDYKHIADVRYQARLSWAEMQRINQEEVAPVLVYNLLSVAGEWGGFDEQWLMQAITAR